MKVSTLKLNVFLLCVVGICTASQGAYAAVNNMVECTDFNQRMSWYVNIESDFKLASHFDNDHDTAMNFTGVKTIAGSPSRTNYTFVGKDRTTAIKFVYTAETMTGTLSFANTKVKFNCALKANDFDWAAVSAAIQNSQSNGGSTVY